MAKHYSAWRTPKKYERDDAFDTLKAYFPKGTLELLKRKSEELEIPITRLVSIAVDNELDCSPSFNYPCAFPESEYQELAYLDEAGKIVKFLEKFPLGASVDTLMLCRRDIGIPSRELFMYGYREALKLDIIEEFKPRRTVFRYGKDYTRVRVKHADPAKLKKNKYKRIEGESTKYVRVIRDEDIGDE